MKIHYLLEISIDEAVGSTSKEKVDWILAKVKEYNSPAVMLTQAYGAEVGIRDKAYQILSQHNISIIK
jgi:hypothetical protein